MGRKRISERRRRNSGTAGALLRAALLFGPLGAALAIVSVIGSWDEPVRAIAPEQVDAMATGSIGPARILPSNRGLLDRPNGGPCLRFPDGSQRGQLLMRALRAFRQSASGATAIEYGLIAALIGTAILGALTATGISVGEQWAAWTGAVVEALRR